MGGQSLRRGQHGGQGAAKAFGAVKKGVKMAQWALKNNRKANSVSGAVVAVGHMVPAMGLHAIRQFPRLLGGRKLLKMAQNRPKMAQNRI